jgi:hypothetical protein
MQQREFNWPSSFVKTTVNKQAKSNSKKARPARLVAEHHTTTADGKQGKVWASHQRIAAKAFLH